MGFHRQFTVSEAMVQASFCILHFFQDEVNGTAGGCFIFGFIQDPGPQGQGRNHQAVPVGENLIVF